MEKMRSWIELVTISAQNTFSSILDFIPSVLGAFLLILLGWIIAKILQKVSQKVFEVINVDQVSQKSGIEKFLVSSGFPSKLSWVLSRIVFWTVIILFLNPIAQILGFDFLTTIINTVLTYIPNIVVALLIILFGSWGAKVISGLVRGSAVRLGLEYSEIIGSIAGTIVLIITFIITLSQLQIEADILKYLLLIAIASVSIAFAISFGFGTKDIFSNVIAGVYISKSIKLGSEVSLDNKRGILVEVGTIISTVKLNDGGEVKITNSQILNKLNT